jgi:hypothetical protein
MNICRDNVHYVLLWGCPQFSLEVRRVWPLAPHFQHFCFPFAGGDVLHCRCLLAHDVHPILWLNPGEETVWGGDGFVYRLDRNPLPVGKGTIAWRVGDHWA